MLRSKWTVAIAAAAGGVATSAAADDAVPLGAAAAYEHVSCKNEPNELRIVVSKVKQSEGLITADLYRNDEAGFLHSEGRVAQVRFAARAPYTIFCMQAPAAGEYAVAVYHDRNANKTFDKNSIGLPAEPYGVSNNPRMRFRPPRVEEALFSLQAEGTIIEIDLRN